VKLRETSLGVICGALLLLARADAAPRDFTSEARTVYAVAACGEPAPAPHDRKVIAAHCKELAKTVGLWRSKWFAKASPFFGKLLEKGYPSTVVYPFGGGDVVTMLAVYPDATDYTSMSLEGIGDPRPIGELGGKAKPRLAGELGKLRKLLVGNLGWAWNTTIQLSIESSESGAGIPNILAIAMVALEAHGYEPLEARYFDLNADGSLTYLTQERIDAWDADPANLVTARAKRKKTHDLQHGIFNNIEIVFRKQGDASAPKKTFRHIAADLSDAGVEKHAGAIAYIDRKKSLAAMTKAASYLLWDADFDKLRTMLLARMKLMVSDDTGIPPRHARPAGFTQVVFGTYLGAFFKFADDDVEKEMVELWRGAAEKTLGFPFGYYDNRRNSHVMFTYK